MRIVGVRELKSRLSEYLRSVQGGERVLVTDRGRVIATLGPAKDADALAVDVRLAELVRRGLAKPGAPNRPEAYPRMKPVLLASGVTSQRLLDEERGEE